MLDVTRKFSLLPTDNRFSAHFSKHRMNPRGFFAVQEEKETCLMPPYCGFHFPQMFPLNCLCA